MAPQAPAWISGECADGLCGACPGEPLTDDLPPCGHKCHDHPEGDLDDDC